MLSLTHSPGHKVLMLHAVHQATCTGMQTKLRRAMCHMRTQINRGEREVGRVRRTLAHGTIVCSRKASRIR